MCVFLYAHFTMLLQLGLVPGPEHCPGKQEPVGGSGLNSKKEKGLTTMAV